MMADNDSWLTKLRLGWMRLRVRLVAGRTHYPNLYDQLANTAVCFDLRSATEEQLIRMTSNTARLMDGLIQEMNAREMPSEEVIDQIYARMENGSQRNVTP